MFEKELMISGIRRQHRLIEDLIQNLEEKSRLDRSDCFVYDERTKVVAKNLKKLRKIKKNYCEQTLSFS